MYQHSACTCLLSLNCKIVWPITMNLYIYVFFHGEDLYIIPINSLWHKTLISYKTCIRDICQDHLLSDGYRAGTGLQKLFPHYKINLITIFISFVIKSYKLIVVSEFPWYEKLTKMQHEVFKVKELRPYQLATMNATLSKHDALLIMPTGGGKSLTYQLPALIEKGTKKPLFYLCIICAISLLHPNNSYSCNYSKRR